MSPYCVVHPAMMWQICTLKSLRTIYLLGVDSGWTCPDKPLWTFNKSSHWKRKTFKTDWLTADSFMTKLQLLRRENSSLAKSMIVYSCVSLSPLIWPESFTSLQHYKTRVPLIDCSYDSSCHVTPVAFLQCVITSAYQTLLFMHNEEEVMRLQLLTCCLLMISPGWFAENYCRFNPVSMVVSATWHVDIWN